MANETQKMTAVSLFAGVGGFDLALERNGVNVVAAVEIDKHAQSVLSKQFPNTKLFNDVTEVTGEQLISAGFDPRNGILVGGFPCQDLSVAGRRAGLAGKRSGLFYQVARIIEELQPEWFVLENVPGLLSSQRGADMGAVVGTLVDLGYGVSWRVLDAQYFGVPQRRRRVFIVGRRSGDWRSATEVLFERQSVRGNPQEGGATREEVARAFAEGPAEPGGGLHGVERVVITQNQRGDISVGEVSPTLLAAHGSNNHPYAFESAGEGVTVADESAPAPFSRSSFGGYAEGMGTLTASMAHRYDDQIIVEAGAFHKSGFSEYAEGAGTLRASSSQEDHVVVERVVNSINGESISPTVTASGSDYIGLGIPMVSIDTHIAPTETANTLMSASGRGSPAGEHLIVTERHTAPYRVNATLLSGGGSGAPSVQAGGMGDNLVITERIVTER